MGLEEGGRALSKIGLDPSPERRSALIVKRGKLGVRQRFEPGLQLRICVQRSLKPLAVAQFDHPPSAAAENLVEPFEHAVRARRVEALAIVVDDPPEIADIMLRA